MDIAYVVVTVVTILMTGGIALAGFAGAKPVIATLDEVKVPRSWMRPLAALKLAGAIGLIGGLAGVRPLGIAAATGLVLFFLGAVSTHVRARVLYNLGFPGTFLVFSAGSLALVIAH